MKMKIKFKVLHTYGLAREEVFTKEDLGLEHISSNDGNKENKDLSNLIKPLLMNWTEKHYNYGDALPIWEIVYE